MIHFIAGFFDEIWPDLELNPVGKCHVNIKYNLLFTHPQADLFHTDCAQYSKSPEWKWMHYCHNIFLNMSKSHNTYSVTSPGVICTCDDVNWDCKNVCICNCTFPVNQVKLILILYDRLLKSETYIVLICAGKGNI